MSDQSNRPPRQDSVPPEHQTQVLEWHESGYSTMRICAALERQFGVAVDVRALREFLLDQKRAKRAARPQSMQETVQGVVEDSIRHLVRLEFDMEDYRRCLADPGDLTPEQWRNLKLVGQSQATMKRLALQTLRAFGSPKLAREVEARILQRLDLLIEEARPQPAAPQETPKPPKPRTKPPGGYWN